MGQGLLAYAVSTDLDVSLIGIATIFAMCAGSWYWLSQVRHVPPSCSASCVRASIMTPVKKRWPGISYFLLSREGQRASGVSL